MTTTSSSLHPAERTYREGIRQLAIDRAELAAERAAAMRRELAAGRSQRQVAAEFGVSQPTLMEFLAKHSPASATR